MKLKAKFKPRRDGSFGRVGTTPIEADGTVEIKDISEVKRLIGTGNFEPYTVSDMEALFPKEKEADTVTMIITNGDEEVDLMTMNKEELLWLAREEMSLNVNSNYGEKKLRDAIFAHVNQPAGE